MFTEQNFVMSFLVTILCIIVLRDNIECKYYSLKEKLKTKWKSKNMKSAIDKMIEKGKFQEKVVIFQNKVVDISTKKAFSLQSPYFKGTKFFSTEELREKFMEITIKFWQDFTKKEALILTVSSSSDGWLTETTFQFELNPNLSTIEVDDPLDMNKIKSELKKFESIEEIDKEIKRLEVEKEKLFSNQE
jgi:hypothetical protein